MITLYGDSELQVTGYGEITSAERTLWGGNSLLAIPSREPVAPLISSSNANDADKGTGARSVVVVYVDYKTRNTVSREIVLNGQGGVLLGADVIDIIQVFVVTTGSGNTNEGVIYIGTGVITAGVPASVIDVVPASTGMSQTCACTPSKGFWRVDKIIFSPTEPITEFTASLVVTRDDGTTHYIASTTYDDTVGSLEWNLYLPLSFRSVDQVSLRIKDSTVVGILHAHMKLTKLK
jgi:hypothetical protein